VKTTLKRLLWIATTPLALSVLLCASPVSAGGSEPAHGEDAAEAGHHGSPNPIKNFANFGYRGKDDHGGAYEPDKGDHKMPAPFAMSLLNFGVLLFLLGKFAAPGIKKMTADRHDVIAKQLAESAKLRDEAKIKLDEYSRKVSDLDAEIARLVDGIRLEAETEKNRVIREATERAERMKKDAEQQIQAEMARVRAELEREATLAALAVAEKLLTEKTTDADQKAMSERFIQALGSQPAGPKA
jgi:F-type H+-transporting ATPase subunit b